jgi:hypothetical protein
VQIDDELEKSFVVWMTERKIIMIRSEVFYGLVLNEIAYTLLLLDFLLNKVQNVQVSDTTGDAMKSY